MRRPGCRLVSRSSGDDSDSDNDQSDDNDHVRGWKLNGPFPATDRRTLQELSLPKENFLYLLTPEIPPVLLNGEEK